MFLGFSYVSVGDGEKFAHQKYKIQQKSVIFDGTGHSSFVDSWVSNADRQRSAATAVTPPAATTAPTSANNTE